MLNYYKSELVEEWETPCHNYLFEGRTLTECIMFLFGLAEATRASHVDFEFIGWRTVNYFTIKWAVEWRSGKFIWVEIHYRIDADEEGYVVYPYTIIVRREL